MRLSILGLCLLAFTMSLMPINSYATDSQTQEISVPRRIHDHSVSKGGYILRSPKTACEWDSYHAIRMSEIHERYCPQKQYQYVSPEENSDNNFCFIYLENNKSNSMVIGVIRVDLKPHNKTASLRWVAINAYFQKQGHGRRMVEMAEAYIKKRGYAIIQVPAEKESQGFYERLGYSLKPWPDGPNHPGEVSMAKELY